MSEGQKVTGLFAFWKYDKFPYLLGAEIEEIYDSGYIKPVGYGGRKFKPEAILTLKAGIKIWEKLEKLSQDLYHEKQKLKMKYDAAAVKVILGED